MLKTVNVIEFVDGEISGLKSFPDTLTGMRKSDDLFVKVAMENGASRRKAGNALVSGYYKRGNYKVLLVSSPM